MSACPLRHKRSGCLNYPRATRTSERQASLVSQSGPGGSVGLFHTLPPSLPHMHVRRINLLCKRKVSVQHTLATPTPTPTHGLATVCRYENPLRGSAHGALMLVKGEEVEVISAQDSDWWEVGAGHTEQGGWVGHPQVKVDVPHVCHTWPLCTQH